MKIFHSEFSSPGAKLIAVYLHIEKDLYNVDTKVTMKAMVDIKKQAHSHQLREYNYMCSNNSVMNLKGNNSGKEVVNG